jgi:hypothetical protein
LSVRRFTHTMLERPKEIKTCHVFPSIVPSINYLNVCWCAFRYLMVHSALARHSTYTGPCRAYNVNGCTLSVHHKLVFVGALAPQEGDINYVVWFSFYVM